MSLVILQVIAFICGLVLILLGVDKFMDNAREIIEKRHVSPYILGAILFGVDLEEIIASVAAAILGYPTVAVGNAIGNNTLALTLPLAIPGLFMAYKLKDTPRPFIMVITGQIIVLGISIVLNVGVGLTFSVLGIVMIGLYTALLIYNVRFVQKSIKTSPGSDLDKLLEDRVDIERGSDNNDENDDDEKDKLHGDERGSKRGHQRKVLIMVTAAIAVSAGAWLLGDGLEGLVDGLGISQHVVGYVIVALGVNIEEFAIAFQSAKRKIPELGVGTLLMKTAWNLGITYGVSVLINGNVPIEPSLLWNVLLLVVAFSSVVVILRYKKMNKIIAIALIAIFILVMVVNLNL